MIPLKVFLLLAYAFLTFPFSKSARIIITSLLNKHSYRLDNHTKKSWKSPGRYLRHAMHFIINKKPSKHQVFSKNQNVAIFDGKENSLVDRFEYLRRLDTPSPGIGISRESLYISGFSNKFISLILLTVLSLWIIPSSVFTKNRKGSISLILLEFAEWIALLNILKSNKCNYLYHFCSYEKDAPFIGWLNKHLGIIDHKIPSSNPLSNFYKYTFCDKLAITTPFQKPEFEFLSKNWRVKEFTYWPIENFHKLIPFLNNGGSSTPQKYNLGFLSSGIWLRQKLGHSPLGVGDQESEIELVGFLKEFLAERPEISFIILLHPIEKKAYEEACHYYRALFNNVTIHFGEQNKNSFEYFDSIDTAIAAYSSTNLQRLFCGYKTLYAPLKFKYKIYDGSSIQNIAPTNKKRLFDILEEVLNISDEDFFNTFDLWAYHHSNYNFY